MSDDTTEIEIPPGAHRLPSGGWVLLTEESEHNGRDVYELRRALDVKGSGSQGSAVLQAAIGLRVRQWHIPGRPNLPLPRGNTTWLPMLTVADTLALEELVQDWAQWLATGVPRDPQKPASESGPETE